MPAHYRTFLVTTALVLVAAAPALAQNASLRVRAAIVMDDLSVRPIPSLPLYVISPAGDTARIETDLEGVAQVQVQPGEYRVTSMEPFRFAELAMVWSQGITVSPEGARLDLTSRNATAPDGSPLGAVKVATPTARRVSEEAEVFNRVRSGVFTIWGEEGKGSGFLIDPAGLVLTNAHVVRGSSEVRVQIGEEIKVRARIVEVDNDRDVAVLLIPMSRCQGCYVLPMADATGGPLAVTGERILAIGSPLNQAGVLTLGIVSSIQERAILSDVNINPGNSGGPMLNALGEVIGINTFADPNQRGGPGVSGAITITQALRVLDVARGALAVGRIEPPSDSLMPNLPKAAFPMDALREIASQRRFDLRPYSGNVGGFDVLVMTPPVLAWRSAQAQEALLERRRRREERASVGQNERVDPLQNWFEWDEYVGERRAGVMIYALPEVGETRASGWANALGAVSAGISGTVYRGNQVLEFKGDFQQMILYRDGEEVIPVSRTRTPAVLDISSYSAQGKDFAFQGVYTYHPSVFAPRANGTFASYRITIVDTARPDRTLELELNRRTIEAIWRDFGPMAEVLED